MPQKILIVEDEDSILTPLVNKLRERHLDVYSAVNGQEGLAVAIKVLPDLVVADLLMPVMDGAEMVKRLRLDPNGKNMKVMILTNSIDAAKAGEMAGLGIIDYIVKADWDLKGIVDRIANELGAG